ncbi:MAG: leucine-rich repeat protein [Prevotella sp.]|nr:leucine-rich repeat protein [Alistipes senegalensis]MCM1357287.1 leucine-rich repeat protein [Prevotella sp.]
MKKYNRIIAGIMAICLMCGIGIVPESIFPEISITASAEEDYTYENLIYKLSENGTIEITGCDKSVTSVVIPNVIEGIKVTGIGYYAFSACKNLTEIKIPDSVASINIGAFSGCKSLKDITLPDSITDIYSSTFYGCTSLKEISIPDSVTNIDGSAFADCTSLTKITIPDSVKNIYISAFNGCTKLTSINVSENNENYSSIDGVLFNKDKSEIIKYPPELSADIYEIPESVKTIGNYAFSGCMNLKEIKIPESVASIGIGAFSECKRLTEITIPDGVKSVGDKAFKNCMNLTSINIPDSVEKIGSKVFSGTSWLKTKQKENPLVIVNNILIDGVVCYGDVVIPDGTTTINSDAFSGCKSFLNITIPDSVKIIGDNAFKGCTGLKLILLPESITTIGYGAFKDCTGLMSMYLPESVTLIDYDAFRNCKNLSDISILNLECTIKEDNGSTFSNGVNQETGEYYFKGTIYGYTNSTAREYAKKYYCKFVAIDALEDITIMGDLNGDNEFNLSDVVLFQKYLLGEADIETSCWKNADLYPDYILDSFDLCLMKKKLLEK